MCIKGRSFSNSVDVLHYLQKSGILELQAQGDYIIMIIKIGQLSSTQAT